MATNPLFQKKEKSARYLDYEEEKEEISSKELNDDVEDISSRRIQNFFKKIANFQKFKKKLKKLKYRKKIMMEIIETENNYTENLSTVINNVLNPIKNKKVELNFNETEDFLTVFSNLESIKTLHEKLHFKLRKKFDSYGHNSIFGPIFLEFLPFFKLYFIYCEEFEANMRFLESIKSKSNKLRVFLEEMEFTPTLKDQNLMSFLIMPVQRICRYVLFLKDLIKYTDNFHPDYDNLQKTLTKFIDLNSENNQKMNKCIQNLKLFDLQRLFGSEDLLILDAKRDFICEEPFEMLINSKSIPTIVYILTDLILITEHGGILGGEKLLNFVFLDENSSVKNLQNTKYFSDLFSLHGVDSCVTFLAGNSENKEKYMKIFQGLIDNLRTNYQNKQNIIKSNSHTSSKRMSLDAELNLEVNVIGTEERFFGGFFGQTVYIIEIKTFFYAQRIYMNYSEIYDLYKRIKKQFPCVVLPLMERLSIFYKKTKTIESRKILIENFLLTVIRNEKIRANGEIILKFLNLPTDFFYNLSSNTNILRLSHEKKEEENLPNTPEKKNRRSKRNENLTSMSKVLIESNEKKKNLLGFFSVEQDKVNKEIEIRLMDNSLIKIKISQTTTASEACELIGKQINLLFFDDFKLYLYDSGNQYKLLEDDEVLFQFLFKKEFNKMRESSLSFLKRIGKKIKHSLDLKEIFKGKLVLIFKKYLFLQRDLEKNDWAIDKVRTKLIAFQNFNDVAQEKYPLSFNEFCLVAAFYGFVLFGPFNENLNFLEILPKVILTIPEDIYKQKTHEFWNMMILKKWKKLGEKFEEKNLNFCMKNDQNVVEMNFIQMMQKNEIFGVTFFEIEIYKNTDFPSSENLLGVKYDGILIMSMDKKQKLLFSEYKDIKSTIVHPKSIIFEFENKVLRLNTIKSFEISQMINLYRKILSVIKE